MQPKIELILLGGKPFITSTNTNYTAAGVVDLYGNEEIQLNISCADIKDIKVRKGTFSQSFTVPGTKNNNTLFNQIFEIGSDSQFDPRKKTPCQLLVDGIPVVTIGNLQLISIVVNDDREIIYQVNIFDETEDLVDALGSAELDRLDYSNLDHIWDYNTIISTWSGTSQPFFYPLIDYGYDFNMTDMKSGAEVPIEHMYPAIQVKTIWDKIFDTSGYKYTSNFINTEYFKNLYIPYNGNYDVILKQESLDVLKFLANKTSNSTLTWIGSLATNIGNTYPITLGPKSFTIPFDNDSVLPGFDAGSAYNTSTFRYTTTGITNQTFTAQFFYSIPTPVGWIFDSWVNSEIKIEFWRSSKASAFDSYSDTSGIYFDGIPRQVGPFTSRQLNGSAGSLNEPSIPGETFWVNVRFGGTCFLRTFSTSPAINITFYKQVGSSYTAWWNTPINNISKGQTISYNNLIPKKIKQIDFINSIMTMHNLYVIADQDNPKNLTIEPRDDYYDAGVTKDWSQKLDLLNPVNVTLLSEQHNNRIVFSYKNDNDYYNQDYNRITNRIFGDEYVEMNNDFTKDDQKINVIFSPTPSIPVLETASEIVPGTTATTVNDFVLPKIGKVASKEFGRTDFNIRILQKNENNLLSLANGKYWKLSGQKQYSYPYLGMLNHPFNGDTDIAFGTVDYEYYVMPSITSNNLVNRFYRKYLDQIIDKNGKLIKAKFYLTPADIQNFKFNDTIFVQGLTNPDIGEYFIVNSIKYSPTNNVPSDVELIQVTNKQVNVVNTPIKLRKPKPINVLSIGNSQVGSVISAGIGSVSISEYSWGVIGVGKEITIFGGGSTAFIVGSGTTIGSGFMNVTAIGNGNTVGDVPFNVDILGNGNTVGDLNITTSITGDLNIVGSAVTFTNIYGSSNRISDNTSNSNINGSNNIILSISDTSGTTSTNTNNVTIFGSTNTVGSTNNNIFIVGSNTTVNSGLTNVFILGSGFTGTQSDTLYVQNIQLGPGGTISGCNPCGGSGSTGDDLYWTSGSTGLYAIKAKNNSGLDATGNYAVAEGSGTTASGIASHAEGSVSIASGDNSHAEGEKTSATTAYSHAEGYRTLSAGLGTIGFTVYKGSHTEGGFTVALGAFSHAEGYRTLASGLISHAEGSSTSATTQSSHAEGEGTLASYRQAHAEGLNTIASNEASHAEGISTLAFGISSHAEGNTTQARGEASHAEGASTIAKGDYSHAEGNTTVASGLNSHAEGEETIASGQTSHAEGGFTVAAGDYSHAEGIVTYAIGANSHSEGSGTYAIGQGAHSEGQGTIANGNYSHAEGNGSQTLINATNSHAEGLTTIAAGVNSHAEGDTTIASGLTSHSEGYVTIAYGDYSHTEGYQAQAYGLGSHAEGRETIARGQYSHAEGWFPVAHGNYSHAEGNLTIASGITAHAEGTSTIALGNYSHAEGYFTQANQHSSHAEGYFTQANGQYSHAEGQSTSATTTGAHAEGLGTLASGLYSHAEGSLCGAITYASHAGGFQSNTTRIGEWTRNGFILGSGPPFIPQYGIVSYGKNTTNATLTEIFLSDLATERFIIESNAAYKVNLYALAVDQTTIDSKEWVGSGLIKNVAGTTSLVGTITMTSTNGDLSLATVAITVTADNVNDSLKVEVTGVAATNISWYVKCEYTAIRIS